MSDIPDGRPESRRERARRLAGELRQAVIGPPPRQPGPPWEHHAAYMQWLAENKKPHPVRDSLAHWFAVAFMLASVVGGVLTLTHASLGWP
jgi:hypothetical protein